MKTFLARYPFKFAEIEVYSGGQGEVQNSDDECGQEYDNTRVVALFGTRQRALLLVAAAFFWMQTAISLTSDSNEKQLL